MYVNFFPVQSRAKSRCNFHKILGGAHKGAVPRLTGSGFFCFALSHSSWVATIDVDEDQVYLFFRICCLSCMVEADHFVREPSPVNASICDTPDKAVFLTIVHRRQRELGVAIRHLAQKFDT